MKKKVILSVSAAALVASSLLAFEHGPNTEFDKYQQYQKRDMHHCRPPHGGDDEILRAFRELDLTKKQREKIRELIKKFHEERVHLSDAFTENSFDKEKFINLAKLKRDMRIQKKAELIEKIYNLLTNAQKRDLKTILEMQKIKKRNRMCEHAPLR